MPAYSQKFKERMIERMQGPAAVTATDLAEETGVSQSTLSAWLRDAGTLAPMTTPPPRPPPAGTPLPTVATTTPSPTPPAPRGSRERSPEDKLRLLVLAQPLTGEALGALLRREGVHAAELEAWRLAAFEALLGRSSGAAATGSADRKRIQALERELERKDKALAEAAALLLLQKKLRVYLEGEGELTDGRSGR